MSGSFIHPTVNTEGVFSIGENSRVWSNSQLGINVEIGRNTNIGRNVYLGPGVKIGNNCKIQNNALVYEPARIGDGVFVGPGVILTNDKFPRAVNSDGSLKTPTDWQPLGVEINNGASIGAGAICVAPIEIGEWAVIAAGSVVTKSVLPYALMAGTPARRIGWVGKSGVPLILDSDSTYICPSSGSKYFEKTDGNLVEI